MGRRKDKIKLGAFLLFTGHHVAAWRHPQASVGTDFEDYFELAKLAEAAKFDAIFFADGVAARLKDVEAASRKAHSGVYPFEPITLLSALSSVTSNIGLIATASTSFSDPYNLARQFGSLDRLSGGRAGWNLVTSSDPEAAYNFGHEAQILHADRYDRAEEFADVVLGLWDSWDDDAFIRDRESGRYFDPVRLHRLNHKGRHFKVRGPLNIPRSPQGRPVLVQAGASGPGKELAARTAEAIFAAHITLDEAKTFYADVKGKLGTYGRSPDDLKILPGIFPVVGRSETEAQEKFEALQELIQPQVGLNLLSQLSGVDLSPYPLDGPIPSDLPVTNAGKSRQELVLDLARRENLTIRQLYLRIAGARGHWQVVGTPSQIADVMEERFENYGADGFNIMAPMMPGGLADFIELVVPELRRRGLFRTEYEGTTLRENLGLKRPVNLFAVNNAAAAE
ncbi:LLM class flavin-dependent oxidoreductase [Rhizobium leguminosarum bv. viciae]|uniref:LLM class flavin-dependent oxidoreductase n=1 Tax=Rhizobium leguminosarum TaxID=384 RepID=UPI00103A323A|nr:LLM class flavin-dependent oxidoreductase [Rhizobium leguminosarum]TBZ82958.1 LLM class flavin-dependent oxidoreductase [Rhizobium leguminosarum bv. viciae]